VPAGAACYPPILDEVACNATATNLVSPDFVSSQTVDVMWAHWGGNECPAVFTPGGVCGLGNYSNYVIPAANAETVSLAVKFIAKFNLRAVIKNTGHDFLGRCVILIDLIIRLPNIPKEYWSRKYVDMDASAPRHGIDQELGPSRDKTYYTGPDCCNQVWSRCHMWCSYKVCK